jgi:hypothetical protein
MLEPSVRDLESPIESSTTKVNNPSDKEVIPGTESSETLVGGNTERLAQLPTINIADLEHSYFARQFKLVHSSSTNFGLSPTNIVTVPYYLGTSAHSLT